MIKWVLRVNFFNKLKNSMRANIGLNSQIFLFVSLIILNLRISLKENLKIINTNFSFICYIFHHVINDLKNNNKK